ANSLFRLGMRTVNNHSAASTDASNSGTVSLSLGVATSTGSSLTPPTLAMVTAGGSIWNSIYPTQIWGTQSGTTMTVDGTGATVSLVALGVGPNTSLIGATMTAPPQYPGPASNIYYYRYIPIFAVYSDGRRAQLKGVVDPFGRTIASSLNQYTSSGPDFLPPGVSRTPE
ncbi:MAG TPA: hypothetical protein VG713_12220, partial [Pirellulales bacterium]|nr:hypothetical protein [Pirellulales bacterium]